MIVRTMSIPRTWVVGVLGLACLGLVAAGSTKSEETPLLGVNPGSIESSTSRKDRLPDPARSRSEAFSPAILLEVPPPLVLPAASRPISAPSDHALGPVASEEVQPSKPVTAEGRTAVSSTRAVARFEGTAAPGLRIWLDASNSQGKSLRYLWLQTKGPSVSLEAADAARVPVLVPGDATELAFRLVVSGPDGLDHTSLEIPLDLHARPMLPPVVAADAGDDQTGVVGHRITLNGIRSRPREHAAYRWIQTQGPEAGSPVEEAWVYSFVPTAPGLYRFVLVVAADGVISKPSEVRVSVTDRPPPALAPGTDRSKSDPIEAQARARIRRIEGGRRYAPALAEAFADVAERASLYDEYEQLFSEIARRIDAALPPDRVNREEWDEVVFGPLTDRIVQAVRPLGLDLNRRQARGKAMNEEQKETLGLLFAGISRGFRSEGEGVEAASADEGQGRGSLPKP